MRPFTGWAIVRRDGTWAAASRITKKEPHKIQRGYIAVRVCIRLADEIDTKGQRPGLIYHPRIKHPQEGI